MENSSESVGGSSEKMEKALSGGECSSSLHVASKSEKEDPDLPSDIDGVHVGRRFLRIDGKLVGWTATCEHYRR